MPSHHVMSGIVFGHFSCVQTNENIDKNLDCSCNSRCQHCDPLPVPAFPHLRTCIVSWSASRVSTINICGQNKTREGKMLWWDDSFQREHGCQRPQIGKHSSCCLTDIYESLACRWRDHCLLPKHKDSANPKEGASQNVKLIDTGREWLFC